ncbi:MAG: hypothetical protein HYS56_03860, partial [Candidatus Omnitrophica bacterium]|nr:hypothetical protein [Candidatus Omnitrophota bacterium]
MRQHEAVKRIQQRETGGGWEGIITPLRQPRFSPWLKRITWTVILTFSWQQVAWGTHLDDLVRQPRTVIPQTGTSLNGATSNRLGDVFNHQGVVAPTGLISDNSHPLGEPISLPPVVLANGNELSELQLISANLESPELQILSVLSAGAVFLDTKGNQWSVNRSGMLELSSGSGDARIDLAGFQFFSPKTFQPLDLPTLIFPQGIRAGAIQLIAADRDPEVIDGKRTYAANTLFLDIDGNQWRLTEGGDFERLQESGIAGEIDSVADGEDAASTITARAAMRSQFFQLGEPVVLAEVILPNGIRLKDVELVTADREVEGKEFEAGTLFEDADGNLWRWNDKGTAEIVEGAVTLRAGSEIMIKQGDGREVTLTAQSDVTFSVTDGQWQPIPAGTEFKDQYGYTWRADGSGKINPFQGVFEVGTENGFIITQRFENGAVTHKFALDSETKKPVAAWVWDKKKNEFRFLFADEQYIKAVTPTVDPMMDPRPGLDMGGTPPPFQSPLDLSAPTFISNAVTQGNAVQNGTVDFGPIKETFQDGALIRQEDSSVKVTRTGINGVPLGVDQDGRLTDFVETWTDAEGGQHTVTVVNGRPKEGLLRNTDGSTIRFENFVPVEGKYNGVEYRNGNGAIGEVDIGILTDPEDPNSFEALFRVKFDEGNLTSRTNIKTGETVNYFVVTATLDDGKTEQQSWIDDIRDADGNILIDYVYAGEGDDKQLSKIVNNQTKTVTVYNEFGLAARVTSLDEKTTLITYEYKFYNDEQGNPLKDNSGHVKKEQMTTIFHFGDLQAKEDRYFDKETGNLTKFVNRYGVVFTYEYSKDGDGNTVMKEFRGDQGDPARKLLASRVYAAKDDAAGQYKTGDLVKQVDEVTREVTTFEYTRDHYKDVIESREYEGRTLRYTRTFGAGGLLLSLKDHRTGEEFGYTYDYDGLGNALTIVTNLSDNSSTTYNQLGEMISRKDTKGEVFTITYQRDTQGNPVRADERDSKGLLRSTKVFNNDGSINYVIDYKKDGITPVSYNYYVDENKDGAADRIDQYSRQRNSADDFAGRQATYFLDNNGEVTRMIGYQDDGVTVESHSIYHYTNIELENGREKRVIDFIEVMNPDKADPAKPGEIKAVNYYNYDARTGMVSFIDQWNNQKETTGAYQLSRNVLNDEGETVRSISFEKDGRILSVSEYRARDGDRQEVRVY